MKLAKPVLVLGALLSLFCAGVEPSSAFVGRLPSHSAFHIRKFQQNQKHHRGRTVKTHESASRKHRSHHRLAYLRKGSKSHRAIARSSPSYMWSAPLAPSTDLDEELRDEVAHAFWSGQSGRYAVSSLIDADVISSYPLHGGVFRRKSAIKYIVLHSTETERIADAQRVITSWNGRGLRHPGAQFVVDRDGKIYCTADPVYGTTHVNQAKTRFGISNENSVGIEMVRTREQDYTSEQMSSIVSLVSYLQDRYHVPNDNIYGHGQIQPSDRRDPVNFNWQAFAADKELLSHTAYQP